MIKLPFQNIFLITIFAGLSFFPSQTFSQGLKAFSGDTAKLRSELDACFSQVSDAEMKSVAPVMHDFISNWETSRFDTLKKRVIYAVFNEILRRKLRANPDMVNFMSVMNNYIKAQIAEKYFQPWSRIVLQLLEDKNNRKFLAFVEFSNYFFAENLLFKSSVTQWKVAGSSYTFSFDTVPKIIYPVSNMTCYANKDSLNIYNTKGIYLPLTTTWIGQNGRVNWIRAGEDPSKVFADLRRYTIQMRFSKFSADSAQMTYKKYFPYPVTGRYEDMILADVKPDNATYPKFNSYNKMIGIQKLFDNIDYLGGFALEGRKVFGSGDHGRDARLFFKKNGKDFVTVGADIFVIRSGKINARSASVSLYHDDDSIYHPGLQMSYIDSLKQLAFTKDERVPRISPWYDSYHKIEIYCDAFYWKTSDSQISFQAMKGPSKEGKAVFESSAYYSMPRYEKLQGIDETNPLVLIRLFTEKKKSRSFTLDELTKYMKTPPEQVENQLLNLAVWGFLVYDSENKTGLVKSKLYNYINDYNGTSDYDGIYFNSLVTNASNGLLNLETFDFHLKGVEKVVLSDTQTVQIFPEGKEIVLKKGLDFLFSGRIEAGLFDLYAKDCAFTYSRFRISMPQIDSMFFYVFGKTVNPKTGKYPFTRIKTAITNLGGSLLIDDPKNKSGLKQFPDYPIFTNEKNAFVYWNNKKIQSGVYEKEKFHYEVNPFTIKRLDDLMPDTLKFAGVLNSAGIFPEMTEPLQVRPDQSLGIMKSTGDNGLPVYGNKGTFTGKIDLSNKGLRADGKLSCLNSVTGSKDFLFLPDSLKTITNSFDIAESMVPSEFPKLQGDTLKQFWMPYKDTMTLKTILKPVTMYRDQSKFMGLLSLTPALLTGDGTIRIKDAEMDSRKFKFRSRTFDALIANFRIKSVDLAALAISTKNYQTQFNFDTRKGEFKSNVGISKGEFPINQYVCSMDRFDWLIDNDEIMLTNELKLSKKADTLDLAQLIDVGYTGSEFVSVHPSQDSLKFFAARARYNLKNNIINAEDVRIVKVADAAIYPDSGKVVIMKNAEMKVLNHAMVITNTQSKYHQFYNADISIGSRKNYTGKGEYDYIDRNRNRQKIFFTQIRVDSSGSTTASGTISDSASFLLSPEFAFKGSVTLTAKDKNLFFDGGFHPVTTCFTEVPQWIRFGSPVDPENVMIPLTNPLRSMDHEPILLGLIFRNTGFSVAPSFFRPKISINDSLMCTAGGYITYNAPTNEFRIGSDQKLKDISKMAPYLALNTWNCKMRGEGKINLSMNSEMCKIETYGILDYFIIPDSTRIRCSMTINAPMSEAGLQRCADQFNAINLPGITPGSTHYPEFIARNTTSEEFLQLKNELDLLGKFRKMPEKLERTLAIADVTLYWDSVSKSYLSTGNIGLAAIGKNQVNKSVKGKIEFTRKRNGDELTVYLELTETDWYYFNYRNRQLNVLSSDIGFNDRIRQDLQSNQEMKRVKELAKGYRYTLAPETSKRKFLRKFESPESE